MTPSATMQGFSPNRVFQLQLVLLFSLLAICSFLFGITLEQAVFPTVGLLMLVGTAGLLLIARLQHQLADRQLQRLGYIWLAKLGLLLFLLYVGWMPSLPATDVTNAFDPQRYYFQAQAVVENNWSADFIGLNYKGILYYYGFLFYLVGHNPVVPALVNAFTTLLATLFLVRTGYAIKTERRPNDWTLGFAMLLPEVVWYDVMTSRETVMMALLTILLLAAGGYWAANRSLGVPQAILLVAGTGLGVGLIRTSMLLPAVGIIALLFLLLRPAGRRTAAGVLLFSFMVFVLLVSPRLNESLGSTDFSFGGLVERVASGSRSLADFTWSEQSFGRLLIPDNMAEAVVFAFPRAALYMVSPLPRLGFSGAGLLQGSLDDWLAFIPTLSSLLNIALLPLAVASLVQTVSHREQHRAYFVFHVSFWLLFLAIAGGNYIIHERYRVMASLLFWGCIWLGWTACSRNQVQRWYSVWLGILSGAILLYIGYKFWL